MTEFDRFDDEIDALESSLAGASGVAAGFHREMERLRGSFETSSAGARRFESAMGRGVRRAIDGVVLDGGKLSGALDEIAQSMIDASWRAAVRPVASHVGGLITRGVNAVFGTGVFGDGAAVSHGGMQPFATGGTFTQGRVVPFATGGIVAQPTAFPMRGGAGLMGEAGPEAIMPLARTSDGKLGVRTSGGAAQPVTVVVNVSTPDVESFRRSRSQIAAEMGRALSRGQRNR